MKYTKYFRGVLKNHGQLHIKPEHYILIIDISNLEERIETLRFVSKKYKGTDLHYKHDLDIKNVQNEILEKTGGLAPDILLKQMVTDSYE